jgi:putative transposase
MIVWLILLLRLTAASLKSRRNLLLENLALHHQLLVLNRGTKRPRLTPLDRALWVWLPHTWNGWKVSLRLLQPDTVIQRHRAGFRLFWRFKSRPRKAGRSTIAPDIIGLIRQMNHANPLWGAPRIHRELQKLGITVAQRTISKYMVLFMAIYLGQFSIRIGLASARHSCFFHWAPADFESATGVATQS